MIKDRKSSARTTREAADWLDRLDTPPHETEDLEAFSAWRSDPENRAEYERLEDIKRAMATMRDDPDMRQASAEALQRGALRRRRQSLPRLRPRLLIGGFVAAALVAAIGAYTLRMPTYSTRVGETFSATLEDGSRIQLNTDSVVRVRYSAGQRRIDLMRGQALFQVAHNAQRPFIVVAGDTQVRALGTRFDVRKIGQEVRVVLVQGSVEVSDAAVRPTPWRLKAGQSLALPQKASVATAPTTVDTPSATSWTTGNLTFQGVPLAEATAELNRYSRDKIVLAPGVPADRLITGVFPTGDNGDFIAAVSSIFDLKSERKSNGDLELQPKGPTSG